MPDDFMIRRTLLDYTGGALSPNQTLQIQATSVMTINTIANTVTNGAVVGELEDLWIIPPQDSSGSYEDLREVTISLDGNLYQHYINLSGNGWTLTNPKVSNLWGGPVYRITFGMPLWRAIYEQVPNMPLKATCPKFATKLEAQVSTRYGVTGAGSGGWRIVGTGYYYTATALATLAAYKNGWSNDFSYQTVRRIADNKPSLVGPFQPAGGLSLSTFTSYPGGPKQGTIKINPYWQFSYNAQQTQPQDPFLFSNLSEIGGTSNNVEDTYQDLGLQFAQNNNAFILQAIGFRGFPAPPGTVPTVTGFTYPAYPGTPGLNLSRAGVQINGTLLPTVNGSQGWFITETATSAVNPLTYGAVKPSVSLDNVFYPLPRYPGQPELIYQDNFVPFVGANGTPIPPFSVACAMVGVLIERGA
jgi:hypothetical protein